MLKMVSILLSLSLLLGSSAGALDVTKLYNFDLIERVEGAPFSKAQIDALDKVGFFLSPLETKKALDPNEMIYRDFDEMLTDYQKLAGDSDMYERNASNAVFITSDLMLHIYHLLIDKTFQVIEEDEFYPILLDITQKMYTKSLADYEKNEIDVKKCDAAYFLVPLCLLEGAQTEESEKSSDAEVGMPAILDTKIEPASDYDDEDSKAVMAALASHKNSTPKEIYDMANQELKKILKANSTGRSPIFPGNESKQIDYTQFTPRSHYTKNAVLRSYFRALMWYGRMGFEVKDKTLTRMALYIVKNINLLNLLPAWESIYDPTVFFVGESDDLTVYDYTKLINQVYGKITPNLEFPDDQQLISFMQAASKLEGPKILSDMYVFATMEDVPEKAELLESTKAFRFMGQRFIPDSYIFSTLTQGDEPADRETGQKLPSMPTALMVMSIFGSDTADGLLDDWIKKNAPDSDKVIAKYKDKLQKEFAALDDEVWTQNIYWGWIYTFRALFEDYGSEYPIFMQNKSWKEKCLLTSLGSWTELRHDTLLYAKQSAAEMGSGMRQELPGVVKGYVEPNLEFFKRFIILNATTVTELTKFGLLDGERTVQYKKKYEVFASVLSFLERIAQAELSGAKISDDDFEKLRTVPYWLQSTVTPVPYEDVTRLKDTWMGLIADVHTDFKTGQILYEAIGMPVKLFVVIKDQNGARLTRGLTYSYYEFPRGLGKRVNDADWQAIIYEKEGTVPPMPTWTKDIIR
ncbi:MAG: DUF3160 domain-containing protein [Candidatus Saganbacteria bacterium]|nr:DUF3160 domain-containing protein [Candidatus Saganbacteria bacterium]